MEKKYLAFLFIFKLINCITYEYECIEELVSKSSSLYFPGKSYKIYEYIPLCTEEGNLNQNKSSLFKC